MVRGFGASEAHVNHLLNGTLPTLEAIQIHAYRITYELGGEAIHVA
jgi:hypothetical protein